MAEGCVMEEQMRADFEAAYKREAPGWPRGTFDEAALTQTSSGDYRAPLVQAAWWGWQASRAALVVELPESELFGDTWPTPAMRTERVISAIEAAGVRVKS